MQWIYQILSKPFHAIVIAILMCDVILLFKAYHNMKSDSVERAPKWSGILYYLTALSVSLSVYIALRLDDHVKHVSTMIIIILWQAT